MSEAGQGNMGIFLGGLYVHSVIFRAFFIWRRSGCGMHEIIDWYWDDMARKAGALNKERSKETASSPFSGSVVCLCHYIFVNMS